MGAEPSLSVIVPVYNKSGALRNCLLPLKQQTHPPDELIVSDDGSDEDIPALLHEYGSSVPFPIRYVCQSHRGFRAGKCRNNAARIARGDYLVFCDQDLVPTRGYLDTFMKHRRPKRFLSAEAIYLDEAQTLCLDADCITAGRLERLLTAPQRDSIRRRYRRERMYSRLRRLHLRYMGAKLRGGLFGLERADFQAVNGFDEQYRDGGDEDDDLGFRLNAIGIVGWNPSPQVFALHQYHERNYPRVNPPVKAYYALRRREIRRGSFRCEYGLDNPLDGEPVRIQTLD